MKPRGIERFEEAESLEYVKRRFLYNGDQNLNEIIRKLNSNERNFYSSLGSERDKTGIWKEYLEEEELN